MDVDKLYSLSYNQLKTMGKTLNIPIPKSKVQLISDITKSIRQYEKYKKNNIDCYEKIKQLGKKGKEGTTYLVKKGDNNYAMKTFRSQKAVSTLNKEAELQKRASLEGISPEVIDVNLVEKYIVMDKLDHHLIDIISKNNNTLSISYQKKLVDIYKKLDSIGIFHGDANLLNYMVKGRKLYIIDYGMAREITPQLVSKLGTTTPNLNIMTLGFILKLRSMGFEISSYEYLLTQLSQTQIEKFRLLS